MIKNILFDFDGVILDSMPVREYGFREIFKEFDIALVDQLIEYHELNGGLSRFVKIKYFYEELLNQTIDEKLILEYADNFSEIMKKELTNKKYLIEQTVEFITNHTQEYNLHIVSGSEQNELRYLCKELGLSQYFDSIHGSPTPKNTLVKDLLEKHNYNTQETILIGDSINDYEAATINNISFYGYNNEELLSLSSNYLLNYQEFIISKKNANNETNIEQDLEKKDIFNLKELNRFETIKHYNAFDRLYYISHNPDVEDSNIDPFFHYTKHGWREGRKPNRWFDPAYYLNKYEDIAACGAEPLFHYLRAGKDEKRFYGESMKEKGYPAYRADIPLNYQTYCKQFNLTSIDIIIPIHNALDDVKLCLESLYDTQTYAFNLIVVDDASDEECREYLLEQSIERGFQLIRHEENRRFTHSVNSGLAQSQADYAILLNSDTIVTKNWIEKIIACFESDNQIGVVGPLSNAASWQSVPQRSKPEGGWMVNDIPQGYTIEQMGLLIETISKKSYPKVPSVNGFCYAIKKEIIEEIGNFDTEYFPTGYGEEDDYSIRVREAGYEIAIADDTYIYHAKSKSYTHQIREELTANGRLALDKKHGKERIDRLIQDWKADTAITNISKTINNILHHSKGNKKVVYTAIFGPYDDLKKPEYINDDWDYVCFTDNQELKSDIYTIKYIEPLFKNSTKNARMFKLLSHIFLVNYYYSLWVDGSIKIRGKNIDDLITDLNKKRQYLSIHSHIKRDCIYDEAMACILADKAHPSEVIPQVRHYKQNNFPEKYGLVESAEILRNHQEIKTQQLNQAWWEVLDQFSIRDQLAFNYICWRDQFTYHKMAGHQWLDQYFHLYKHGITEKPNDNLPAVSIAMLLYSNNLEKIENTINNIIDKTEYPNYTITLINLNQDEESHEDIQKIIKKETIIEDIVVAENITDTEAINNFISEATQEYSCIIDDNISIITTDWLKRLVNHISESEKYMAVGPTILDKDFMISSSSIRVRKFNDQKIEYSESNKIGGHGTVDAIPPVATLINTKLFQNSHKLNSTYDLKTAWIKFCMESRQSGLQIRFDVDSEVVNIAKKGETTHVYL